MVRHPNGGRRELRLGVSAGGVRAVLASIANRRGAKVLRMRRSILTSGALLAVAIGMPGCPDSSPPRTGLEPTSPAAQRPRSDEERHAGTYVYTGSDAERAA